MRVGLLGCFMIKQRRSRYLWFTYSVNAFLITNGIKILPGCLTTEGLGMSNDKKTIRQKSLDMWGKETFIIKEKWFLDKIMLEI